jgi:YD repeat-containing protein
VRLPSTRFFPAALVGFVVLVALSGPATAQTSGLSCDPCPGANLPAWNCPVQEEIQISSGCQGFNNCQTPETAPQGVEIVQTGTTPSGGGIFEARLSVEVKARWNSKADIGPNGKLDMWWRSGGTATHPTSDLCEHNTTDRVYTQLRFESLSCDGAPYSLGTYSMRAVVCGGSTCQRISDESGLSVQVTKEMLGCPDPPKESCNGDAACTTCLAGGASAGGAPPAFGGSGFPFTGPGATLRYTAGGVGHPGYPGTPDWNLALGRYWSHDYAARIVPDPDESHVWLLTEHGTFREWGSPDGSGVYQTVSPSNEYRTLTWLGAGFGWELRDLDGTVHLFDDDGLWQSSTDRNGNATTGTYSGGQLVSVDFPPGRREDFTYDGSTGKLATIDEVGVDGVTTRTWTYTWDGDDLERIGRPDGTALLFHYDEPSFPGYLTRVELEGTDGTSIRVERGYEYDGEGNAVRTWKGDPSPTGPDAVEVWSLAFDDPALPTQTTVTDPLGNESVYQFARDAVSSNVKVTSISGDCPTCGLGPNTQLFYEDAAHPMLPTRTIDGRGFTTAMSYDAFGMTTSRTEAMGEPEERTTTWTYDATFPALVESIEQPSVAGGAALRTTDFTRDTLGNAFERTITGMESGSGFSYLTETSFNIAGMPLTIDPPGHGTDDVTSFTYDPARGNLIADSRTDPLVGATTYGHDAFNRRTSTTDPNGVETVTLYDALDRVTELRQVGASPPTDDLVTEYEYTVFGDLLRTTLPEGNIIEYGYDAAGRLETMERKPNASTPGERVVYTLDGVGNRTRSSSGGTPAAPPG